MRIAVLADIHANLPALEAVIEDIDRQGVDEVLVGGDLVGRGPQGSAVVRRISERGWRSVRGNHEDYLLSFCRSEVPASWLSTEEWAASRWMAAELDSDSAAYIDALPFSMTSALTDELRLVHGSPRSNCEGIGVWTPAEDLESHLSLVDESVLICGHTHRTMERHLPLGLVVNVGSVGLPFNGDWRAQYAILTRLPDGWHVEFRQIPYDREAFLNAYESSGFLADGGVTATLLRMEVSHARPFLVPFMKWTTARDLDMSTAHIADFLDIYNPNRPLAEFFALL